MSKDFFIVTIDGGAASGKSSTARLLSQGHKLLHVDTGSHYRALTFALIQQHITPQMPNLTDVLSKINIGTIIDGNAARITIESKIPSENDIRSESVNAMVSQFAAIPAVREKLLEYQRSQENVAKKHDFRGLVMEGRDIGSVVFPKAKYRFFLEADPSKRAQRRAAEGLSDSIAERDALDKSRKAAPLVCPEGAERIDTGALNLEEVVAYIGKKIEG